MKQTLSASPAFKAGRCAACSGELPNGHTLIVTDLHDEGPTAREPLRLRLCEPCTREISGWRNVADYTERADTERVRIAEASALVCREAVRASVGTISGLLDALASADLQIDDSAGDLRRTRRLLEAALAAAPGAEVASDHVWRVDGRYDDGQLTWCWVLASDGAYAARLGRETMFSQLGGRATHVHRLTDLARAYANTEALSDQCEDLKADCKALRDDADNYRRVIDAHNARGDELRALGDDLAARLASLMRAEGDVADLTVDATVAILAWETLRQREDLRVSLPVAFDAAAWDAIQGASLPPDCEKTPGCALGAGHAGNCEPETA